MFLSLCPFIPPFSPSVFFLSKFICSPCEIPFLFYITVVFVISMSDPLAIYPSISLSPVSHHTRHVTFLSLGTTNCLTCSRFSYVRFHLPYLFASLGMLPLLIVSLLECSYVFLFPSLLKVSLVSIDLYVHFSPYHLSPAPSFFFVFICPILPLFLSLYICLKALLSLQKTVATNWRSNSLLARRMINDGYATVINPLNGSSSLSRFFLNALSFLPIILRHL